MPRTMPVKPEWLRAGVVGRAIGVDREAKVLRGYVVALKGPFKSEGRGEFDEESLAGIVRLMRENGAAGTKSRFTHPDMSNDGLGKFLGRVKEPRLSTAIVHREGNDVELPAVRADLHFDDSAFDTPSGNLAGYVMNLADNDPDALSSSIVVKPDRVYRLDKEGRPLVDENGDELPPIWRPKEIHASDIVDTGDAVDGILSAGLSADALPLGALWRGAEMLDSVFAGQPREVVEARCRAYLDRYLNRRFGDDDGQDLRRRLRLMELSAK